MKIRGRGPTVSPAISGEVPLAEPEEAEQPQPDEGAEGGPGVHGRDWKSTLTKILMCR